MPPDLLSQLEWYLGKCTKYQRTEQVIPSPVKVLSGNRLVDCLDLVPLGGEVEIRVRQGPVFILDKLMVTKGAVCRREVGKH